MLRLSPLSLVILGAAALAATALGGHTASTAPGGGTGASERPNVLWITCEDMGPHIGPYGDRYAVTPNLDRFATRSLRYDVAWSNAPVCAPARTTLITGLYPPSTGAEHMRSMVRLPAGFKLYPQVLREAGYYCTNNSKEDYNVEPEGRVWDESSNRAHWKGRGTAQPFFAVFNIQITHESNIRKRPHQLVHDPAKAPLPAYHPDAPEVRHDWAQYYDNITTMDSEVGRRLKELEEAGLADDTVVFFYSDHGSGMPRGKRWAGDSGLRVPLLVHFPERFRHLAPKDYRAGGSTARPVSFVDLGPTLLSLCGLKAPEYYQGQAFLGAHEAKPQRYLHGFRGRMDERYDLVRSVRDERYVYLRNYMPQRVHGQYVSYQFETPTTRVWKQLFDAGKLNPAQSAFWSPRPAEELYDLRTDPDEVRNLAADPAHRETLLRLRKVQQTHARKIRDVGLLPEGEMHARAAGRTPYEVSHAADYPFDRIFAAAERATRPADGDLPRLRGLLKDPDGAVRYWAATGLLIRGRPAVAAAGDELVRLLEDPSLCVRLPAAEALARHGSPEEVRKALDSLGALASPEKNPYFVAIQALTIIDELDATAAPLLPAVRTLGKPVAAAHPRTRDYPERLVTKIVADLEPAR